MKTAIRLRGKIVSAKDGKLRYFDKDSGNAVINRFAQGDNPSDWYYFGADGVAVTGLQRLVNKHFAFDQDGKQVKGKIVTLSDKSIRYFDANSGEMAVGKFAEGAKNEWYYFDQTGKAVTGLQRLANKHFTLTKMASRRQGQSSNFADKSIRYFDANSGEMAVGKFAEGAKNEWYYFDQTGKAVTGLQKIGKQTPLLRPRWQAKSRVKSWHFQIKSIRYFDANSGEMATDKFVEGSPNSGYYFDQTGKAVTGLQQVGQQTLYFTQDGKQVKGKVVDVNGVSRYFDANSGDMARSKYGFNLKMEVGCIFDHDGRGQNWKKLIECSSTKINKLYLMIYKTITPLKGSYRFYLVWRMMTIEEKGWNHWKL